MTTPKQRREALLESNVMNGGMKEGRGEPGREGKHETLESSLKLERKQLYYCHRLAHLFFSFCLGPPTSY